jgi:hypothetical protein
VAVKPFSGTTEIVTAELAPPWETLMEFAESVSEKSAVGGRGGGGVIEPPPPPHEAQVRVRMQRSTLGTPVLDRPMTEPHEQSAPGKPKGPHRAWKLGAVKQRGAERHIKPIQIIVKLLNKDIQFF